MKKEKYAIKDIHNGRIISYHSKRENADYYIDKILDKHPWASEFLRIVEIKEGD